MTKLLNFNSGAWAPWPCSTWTPTTSSVCRIFKRGGSGSLGVMKTKQKISPLAISPFCSPKLGEDQKKKVFTPVWSVLLPKKSLHPDSVRLCAQTFCPSYKGGHAAISHTVLCLLYYLATQKGGHGPIAPP